MPPPALAGAADPAQVDAAHERIAGATGGRPIATPYGTEIAFDVDPSGPPAADDSEGFVAPLTDLATIAATGADATSFLHAQLTNDVEHLDRGMARLAGYCTAKGRLLALVCGWRDADALRLALPQPLAAAVRKRLAMYVLRAKARLTDESDCVALLGLTGPAGERALRALGVTPPAPWATAALAADGTEVGSAAPAPDAASPDAAAGGRAVPAAGDAWAGTVLGLPPAPLRVTSPQPAARWLLALPMRRLESAWSAAAAHAPRAPSSAWRLAEALSGVPRIAQGAQELFVPQMLNLELVGAVDFRKGCYPGQEVVARSQYLGKLKRRGFLAVVDGPEPAPGADVLADGAREPVGQVAMAATDPGGSAVVLFEARVDAARDAVLRLSPDGPRLALRELPYPTAS